MSEAVQSSPVLDEVVSFLNAPLPSGGLNYILMANDAEVTKCRDLEANNEDDAEKIRAYLANNADDFGDMLYEFVIKGYIDSRQEVLKFLKELLRGHEIIYMDIEDWSRHAKKLWAYWLKQIFVIDGKITLCDVIKISKR